MTGDINYSLRDHVTSAAFTLSLGKTHVAALVYIDVLLKDNRPALDPATDRIDMGRPTTPRRSPWNQNATGMRGLQERGLVEHIAEQRRRPGEHVLAMTPRRCWKITRAGRLVINLLKETGIYAEYAAAIPTRAVEAS